ncbi:hypothetical protein HMPREF1250_0270 [Megasphaera vaginalis (ex Srinivasan et al. 2021)]|uniref:Uncharacterized protein n=1 Tax=Megasphaera vaginalis (ex Srinivasan et al. 2021) TaxID=1111454 RepID=U7UQM5_9FIRM|nr:hypothetical protein HMPREF1250_0270 [Megasphaera vaginalis (ex Srinivasan et al. 2021)]
MPNIEIKTIADMECLYTEKQSGRQVEKFHIGSTVKSLKNK